MQATLIIKISLFVIGMMITSSAFANNIIDDLKSLQNQISLSKQQDQALEEEETILNEELKGMMSEFDMKRLRTAQIYHHLQSSLRSPARLGFLSNTQKYQDYYRDIQTQTHLQKAMGIELSTLSQQILAIEEKQTSINDYKRKRDLLALTITGHMNDIQSLQKQRRPIDNYEPLIKSLQNNYQSLNDLVADIIPALKVIDNDQPFSITLPVSGIVTQVENGIHITTATESLITAPSSGIVAYANHLKNLGNIIIINHGNGYISILRGMSDIYIRAGLYVQKNEPIGLMSDEKWDKAINSPMLYYELRYNDSIINPLTKITGL
jgi:murein DD-endopeptidase MepM/ murein hydrolase activator NlpD